MKCVEIGHGDPEFWLAFDLKSQAIYLQGTDTPVQLKQAISPDSIHVFDEGPGHTDVTLRRDGSATPTSIAIPGTPVEATHYGAKCQRM